MNEKNVYRVRLMRWGESSTTGRTVTLRLPDDGDEHPFKGLPIGAKNGQMLEMEIALVEGDDDLKSLGRKKPAKKKSAERLPTIDAGKAAESPSDAPREDAEQREMENNASTPAGKSAAAIQNVTRRVVKAGETTEPGDPSIPKEQSDATPDPALNVSESAASLAAARLAARMHKENAVNAAALEQAPTPPVETTNIPQPPQAIAPAPQQPQMPYAPPQAYPPQPQTQIPEQQGHPHGGSGPGLGGGNIYMDAYAQQMGQAAEVLATVAERMDAQAEDDSLQFPTAPQDIEDEGEHPGQVAVRRATALCKAIDKQRAGFYYFMRSRYPSAPALPGEAGDWSRDAKSTRDRVCLHCETGKLTGLAIDEEARRKFEALETEFERSERLR